MTRAEITAEMRRANDYLGYLAQQAAQLNQLAATSADPTIRTALTAVHREKLRFERFKAQLAGMRPEPDRPPARLSKAEITEIHRRRAEALRERERVARERDRLLAQLADAQAQGRALSQRNAELMVAQAAQLDAVVDLIDGHGF